MNQIHTIPQFVFKSNVSINFQSTRMSVKTPNAFRFSEQNFVECLTFPYVLHAHPAPYNLPWFHSLILVIWCLTLPWRCMFIYKSPGLWHPAVLMVDTNFSQEYAVSMLRFELSRVNQPTARLSAEICTWGKWHLVRLKPSYLWMAQLAHGDVIYIDRLQETSVGDGKEISGCLVFCTTFLSPSFYILNTSLGPCFKPNYMYSITLAQFSPVQWC